MPEIEAYRSEHGACPFEEWFDRLPATHALKVGVAIQRMAAGHASGLKAVGRGVSEWRIDWGPGLRVYVGFDGATLIILLGGGSKQRQDQDIRQAQDSWTDYLGRKTKRG